MVIVIIKFNNNNNNNNNNNKIRTLLWTFNLTGVKVY